MLDAGSLTHCFMEAYPWVQAAQKCPLCRRWLTGVAVTCGELLLDWDCAQPYLTPPPLYVSPLQTLPEVTLFSPDQLRRFDRWHVCAHCLTVKATNGWLCVPCFNTWATIASEEPPGK